MTTGVTFRLTTIVAVSFLTIAVIPSVALAQTSIVATCVTDLRTQCTGTEGDALRMCIKARFKEFSLRCQLALVKLAAIVGTQMSALAPGAGDVFLTQGLSGGCACDGNSRRRLSSIPSISST